MKPSNSSLNDVTPHTSSKLSNKDKNSSGSGKKMSSAGAFLKDKHPELFFVAPRPGGYLKHVTSPHKDPSRTEIAKDVEYKNNKSTILAASADAKTVSISEVLDTQMKCPNFHKPSKDEERNNMVRMCSIAFSTVMMLAQHAYKDITIEHVKHTEAYFRGLKQADGYPQNIGQLMQVIANLKRSGKIVTPPPDQEDSDDLEDDPDDIQISDIIN